MLFLEKKEKIYRALGIIVPMVCLFSSFYVAFNTPSLSGTTFYFLLPLTYGIVTYIYSDVFPYHEGGYGIKIFFATSFIRFVFLPVFTCYSGQFDKYGSSYSPSIAYEYAIVVNILEIFFSFYLLHKFYLKDKQRLIRKITRSISKKSNKYDTITVWGLVLIISLTIIIVKRGHLGEVFSAVRFLVVSEGFDYEADYWTYEIWALQTIIISSVIFITSYFQKRNDHKSQKTNVILPLIAVFLMCTIVLTNNRMTMVYYGLCGLCILNVAFPRMKKTTNTFVYITMAVVVVSFTLMKQFSFDATGGESLSVSNDQSSSVISQYVCGIENVAHSYDRWIQNGSQYSVLSIFSELIKFFQITRIPGFLPSFVKDIPATIELASGEFEMVSVAGETLFMGYFWFGWLIDILAVYVIMRLLIYFEIHSRYEVRLGTIFVYCWLSVLYGMWNCYCLQTLWYTMSYIPFFTFLALKFNRLKIKI